MALRKTVARWFTDWPCAPILLAQLNREVLAVPRAHNTPEFGPNAQVVATLLTDWGDSQSPSFLLFKLRGLNSYPDGTFTHCSCQPSLDAHLSGLIRTVEPE
jgi:hypothetical protein